MTEEERKELLLKDLCTRLPYRVKVYAEYIDTDIEVEKVGVLSMVDNDTIIAFTCDDMNCYNYVAIHEVKPYLFPLSSMTEEQKEELITITNGKFRCMLGDINNAIPGKNTGEWEVSENAYINSIKVINILYIWLLKNHFDINGLIPMGLAIDATGLNIY